MLYPVSAQTFHSAAVWMSALTCLHLPLLILGLFKNKITILKPKKPPTSSKSISSNIF